MMFAPQVETSTGIILPPDYIKQATPARATHDDVRRVADRAGGGDEVRDAWLLAPKYVSFTYSSFRLAWALSHHRCGGVVISFGLNQGRSASRR